MSENRLFDYLYDQLRECPQPRAFGRRESGGDWRYYSTAEIVELVNRASIGLLRLGLQPGDKVGTVVYRTSPEWVVLDYALMQIGALNVPMYPTISPREYAYILNEAGVQYCFVGDDDLFDKVSQAGQQTPGLREIFSFSGHPKARKWDVLLGPAPTGDGSTPHEEQTPLPFGGGVGGGVAELERRKAAVRPDDLATIVYTSGTTGNPKGVMLTHRNIVFNVEAMRRLVPLRPGDRTLSFLPVSHVFERVVLYAYTAYGASVTFTGTDNLGGENGDLRALQPHFFSAVPRLLEKVYEKIVDKGLALRGLKRGLFFWALHLSEQWDFDQHPGPWMRLKRWLADRLIFSKWRAALGGSVRGIITGASACPVTIMRAFNAAGIPIREGYGMTEVAPALTFSHYEPGGAMLGTVGLPLDEVEIRIETGPDFRPGEGEIIATSPGVMLGYYRQPEATAEALREEVGRRWYVTGDVGAFVTGPGGRQFLKITDRKKELLKTSGGKYVAPAPLEARLKEHRLVEQAMVVGENRKFVSALIVPAAANLRDWCQKHEIEWTDLPDMIRHPRVIERYQMLVERINPDFAKTDQIKKITLLPEVWEPIRADGSEAELTPTLKLKRRVILNKFQREIEQMYA